MDTVTEKEMAIKMALNGGLGIIHRYMDINEQVSHVIKVKRFLQYIIQEPYCITPETTYNEIYALSEKYNVSSFCVINPQTNDFIGIITHRDIEYMQYCVELYGNQSDNHSGNHSGNQSGTHIDIDNQVGTQITIKDILAHKSPHIITLETDITNSGNKLADKLADKLLGKPNSQGLADKLKIAKELMLRNRIEKIPIITNSKLTGLITLKNIRHYEDNKSKACIDVNGALCVGAAIGIIGDYQERLNKLIQAGVDLICIDVANGFNVNVFNAIKLIREQYPSIVLMVGNVCNWQGYAALAHFDVDCVRVGVGNGSICTTRLETGIGKGQFSAVLECFQYKIFKEQEYKISALSTAMAMQIPIPNIICDGGSLGKTGNKVKALACGSSAVMLGRTLASTEESPGQIIFRNGKRFKYIRGMASTMANLSKQEKTELHTDANASVNVSGNTLLANSGTGLGNTLLANSGTGLGNTKKLKTNFTSEGVDGEQELTGSVADLIEQISGGIKSGMSYLGCENIMQLHNKNAKNEIKFNLVTSIGMTETGIRVKTY
jgi:IMP dehydrogenase